MSEVDDIVKMTGNCKCENTTREFLTHSTFNCCHRNTTVKHTHTDLLYMAARRLDQNKTQ